MYKLKYRLNNRLSSLNQRSSTENLTQSTVLFLSVCFVSGMYFITAYSLFHTLWYHKLFAVASSLIFGYSLLDLYFEYIENKVKTSLPKTAKKLSHYYTHYKGNVIPAIMDTEEKCPAEARLYLIKIRKALMSGNPTREIETLKTSFPFVWFRLLASIMLMAKEKGIGIKQNDRNVINDSSQSNIIGKSLTRITNILSFINVQQGYNDADLRYIQLFLYFSPFLFILGSEWINAKILIEMNMQDVYQGIKAQNMKAYIFLSANLSALFIHWMRKQQI